ncbi:hypothetical protein L1080_031045 [Rhodococcus sp. MSC1_016]|jgi:hypothetical protein|nr:hypothetical protein [Rhodococcus sp. MSC1_016]
MIEPPALGANQLALSERLDDCTLRIEFKSSSPSEAGEALA